MSKSLRLSARWFNRGLWLVALIFAGFLIGLGGIIVDDLPKVEQQRQQEDFIDKAAVQPLRAILADARTAQENADRALEQASLKLQAAQQAYASRRETFSVWLATRIATKLPSQDEELIARTKELDDLKASEIAAQHLLDEQRQVLLDAQQAQNLAQRKIDTLEQAATDRLYAENASSELRVFLYRLALTLPLLGIAGFLFVKQRHSSWWPFVWGFIIFALFAFFVEVVPYLPSYGGYVYYSVGLVMTILLGRYCILSLNRYLSQQALIEKQPDNVRREELDYDTALSRLAKGVCPGCERAVDLKTTANTFCPHCGIGLFNDCSSCTTRKSAFARFCHACGSGSRDNPTVVRHVQA